MKKNILVLFLVAVVMNSTVYAGGNIVPIEAPVEPIPVEPIPVMTTPSPIYLGLGLLWGRFNGCSDGCGYEDVTYGALLRAGYDFNQYFGLEERLLGTFLKADPLGGEELRHIGIYAKPMYPIGEDFNVYALLGYGWTQTKAGRNLEKVDEGGFSAGLGLEYDLSDMEDDREEDTRYEGGFDAQGDQEKGWGLFVDYQRLLIKSDVPDMDVVSGGVTYDF